MNKTRIIADDLVDKTASSYERRERGIFVTARRETLVDAIDASLRQRESEVRAEERERAAKIAEGAFEPAHTYASENATEYMIYDRGQRRAIQNIVAAIRRDEAQEGETNGE